MSKRINWSADGTLAWVTYDGTSRIQYTPAQMAIMDAEPVFEVGSIGTGGFPYNTWYLFNFPAEITVDNFAISHSFGADATLEVSSNSTTGLDGEDWTEVLATTAFIASSTAQDLTPTSPTAGTWLRVKTSRANTQNQSTRRLIIFGEYTSPNFEYWDSAESATLANGYNSFDACLNSTDYSEYIAFKIKNTDAVTHSYTVSIVPMRDGGDTTIGTYFTLSDDSGSTKGATVTLTDITTGTFSVELRVYGDVLKENNPADGRHYFYLQCEETA